MDPLTLEYPRGLTSPEAESMARQLMDLMMVSNPANRLAQQQISELLASLPNITEAELTALGHQESKCPICFTELLAILAEEEMALVMDSPAHPAEDLGVTMLKDTCGHLFCRKDIGKWIRDGHESCPMCRRSFISSMSPLSNDDNTDTPPANLPTGELANFDEVPFLLHELQQIAAMFGQSADHPPSDPSTYEDDRSELVGMYS